MSEDVGLNETKFFEPPGDSFNREESIVGNLANFLTGGLGLIERKKIKKAIGYFTNPTSEVRELGIFVPEVSFPLAASDFSQPGAVKNLRYAWARECGITADHKIKLARIIYVNPKEEYPKRQLRRFHREVALGLAEEYLHMMQIQKEKVGGTPFLSQRFLFKAPPVSNQPHTELDVAAYLMEQGIALKGTYFIKEYDRQRALFA